MRRTLAILAVILSSCAAQGAITDVPPEQQPEAVVTVVTVAPPEQAVTGEQPRAIVPAASAEEEAASAALRDQMGFVMTYDCDSQGRPDLQIRYDSIGWWTNLTPTYNALPSEITFEWLASMCAL